MYRRLPLPDWLKPLSNALSNVVYSGREAYLNRAVGSLHGHTHTPGGNRVFISWIPKSGSIMLEGEFTLQELAALADYVEVAQERFDGRTWAEINREEEDEET